VAQDEWYDSQAGHTQRRKRNFNIKLSESQVSEQQTTISCDSKTKQNKKIQRVTTLNFMQLHFFVIIHNRNSYSEVNLV